jgi:hypothetical protein
MLPPGTGKDGKRAPDPDPIDDLLASLGPAEAPPDLVDAVLDRISHPAAPQPVTTLHPTMHSPQRGAPARFVRRPTPKRGEIVNKRIIFGLAAAAAVVLAVITYTSFPPATEGTEATIGAAQRAQTPQIASKDVGLGDTSAQDMLQTETWDAIMKDEELRSTLESADVRKMLEDADLRRALENDAVREGLQQAEFIHAHKTRLSGAEARSTNAKVNAAFANENFARAMARADKKLAANLLNARINRALSSEAMARAVRDRGFEAAIRSDSFARALARPR